MNSWSELARAADEHVLAWAETQAWARAMAACHQDSEWHAEGDVWTHTRMVVRELTRLSEWPRLDRAAQLTLLLAAIFHDAGKPAVTALDPETGRLRSPKHALVGAALARHILRQLGCDLEQRERIVALVRYHGRPPYLLEKVRPEREVISLSWLVDNQLLYLLALADTRGREARERSRPEENIHLWKLMADEQGCFDRPYPFCNDQARFLFYREQLSSLFYTPREDHSCVVMLMSGVPASGKDTWLARNRPGAPVVSLDDIRAELDVPATGEQGAVIQFARERCREHLRARRDFAFNATNVTRQMRQRWINLFADYDARIEIVYLEPPLPVILEHNAARDRAVPPKVIERLLEKTEPPTIAEAHAVRFVGESSASVEVAT